MLIAARLTAQSSDTLVSREVAPGVLYRHFVDAAGPFVMDLVRVDLRRRDIEIRHTRAADQLRGRERTSAMASRAAQAGVSVLAAMNGDFFSLETGENENNQVLDGEWWKGLKVTDSPYDTWHNTHVQFAMDAGGRPLMDRFVFDGAAWARGVMTPITTLNFNPSGNPEGTALYTARYGASTPRDTARLTAEAALVLAGRRGDTILYVRRGTVMATSGSPIPSNGAVLAAYGAGSRNTEVKALVDGDTVRVLLRTLPRMPGNPALVIGGWPRILRDGVDVAVDAATLEGTISRNAEVRHPRSAIGFSRDSTTLFLLTVDGRQAASTGVTTSELAGIMRRLGAWNAMNFDGGGSTTMVVAGTVVNHPSDAIGERDVGNAILVIRKNPR